MRPSSAPLTRTHPCRCQNGKGVHPAVAMIAGLPLMVCPDADGDAMRVAFGKDGIPFLLVGDGTGLTEVERLRAEVREMAGELQELREAVAKRKGKE